MQRHSGIAQSTVSDPARLRHYYGLFLGRVIRVNPANNTVDVRLMTGSICRDLPIVRSFAGTREGEYGLPAIIPPKKDKNEQKDSRAGFGTATAPSSSDQTMSPSGGTSSRGQADEDEDEDGQVEFDDIKEGDPDKPSDKKDTWAIVAFLQSNVRNGVVLGFIYPIGTQMSIKDKQKTKEDRIDWLRRYSSDIYELYTRGGTYEEVFPDGTRIRIGRKAKKQSEQSATNKPDLSDPQAPMNNPTEGSGEDDDPDAPLSLGKGDYENLDKENFEWDPKDESDKKEKWRRGVLAHPSGMRVGFDEKGRVHVRDYNTKDDETDPPEDPSDEDTEHKFNVGDIDLHQRRVWRMAFGDPETLEEDDQQIDGELFWDHEETRVRYRVPEESGDENHELQGDEKRKLYMPGAAPAGGGVKGKVTEVEAEGTEAASDDDKDGKSKDAAAADHMHKAKTGTDEQVKPVGMENKAGEAVELARVDHEHAQGEGEPSDARLKENLNRLMNVLPVIMKLDVVRFQWNDNARSLGIGDSETSLGMIAQQVQEYFPEVVSTYTYNTGDTYYTLDYARLCSVLFIAVQELSNRMDSFERRLERLESS